MGISAQNYKNLFNTRQGTHKIHCIYIEFSGIRHHAPVRIKGAQDGRAVGALVAAHTVTLEFAFGRSHYHIAVGVYLLLLLVPVHGVGDNALPLYVIEDIYIAEGQPVVFVPGGGVLGTLRHQLGLQQAVFVVEIDFEAVPIDFFGEGDGVFLIFIGIHCPRAHLHCQVGLLELADLHATHALHRSSLPVYLGFFRFLGTGKCKKNDTYIYKER